MDWEKSAALGIVTAGIVGLPTLMDGAGSMWGSAGTDIEQFEPVSYGEGASLLPIIDKISPKGKPPIADKLASVGQSLKDAETGTSPVLVSDGIENCGKEPCDIEEQLREQYRIDVTIRLLGFDM